MHLDFHFHVKLPNREELRPRNQELLCILIVVILQLDLGNVVQGSDGVKNVIILIGRVRDLAADVEAISEFGTAPSA